MYKVVGTDALANLELLLSGECDVLDKSAAEGLDPAYLQGLQEEGQLVLGAANVENLKKLRAQANDAYDALKTGKDPEAYARWQSLRSEAEATEDAIEEAGKLTGDPKLVDRLRESRRTIAKTYAVENAINKDTGIVDAIELAAMKEDGVPLDAGLERIAAFANSFERRFDPGGAVKQLKARDT